MVSSEIVLHKQTTSVRFSVTSYFLEGVLFHFSLLLKLSKFFFSNKLLS